MGKTFAYPHSLSTDPPDPGTHAQSDRAKDVHGTKTSGDANLNLNNQKSIKKRNHRHHHKKDHQVDATVRQTMLRNDITN
jgi:hypothetical protein